MAKTVQMGKGLQKPPGARAKAQLSLLGALDTWIVGIQYHSGPLEEGGELLFQRNPFNEFDSNAVEVLSSKSRHVRGHLPRYDAEYFGPLIDSGAVFLKGVAGASNEPTRQKVRLDVYATSKASVLLQENGTDDPRALYHNFLLGVFRSMDKYSLSTLFAFREWFRPIAHERELFPETKLIYRIMKERLSVLREDPREKEWQEFLCIATKNPEFRKRLELLPDNLAG